MLGQVTGAVAAEVFTAVVKPGLVPVTLTVIA
jgi:hypothetical protein